MIYPCSLFFFQQLNFPEVLERHLGSHHLHRGLTNGWLATVWIAFLLSQANHRKVSVQDWAQRHAYTLETLLGQSVRAVEFSDDRLSIILRRLHDAPWQDLEADLWQANWRFFLRERRVKILSHRTAAFVCLQYGRNGCFR